MYTDAQDSDYTPTRWRHFMWGLKYFKWVFTQPWGYKRRVFKKALVEFRRATYSFERRKAIWYREP